MSCCSLHNWFLKAKSWNCFCSCFCSNFNSLNSCFLQNGEKISWNHDFSWIFPWNFIPKVMFVIKFLVVFISINNFGSRRGHYNAINFKFSRSFSSLFLQKMDFFVKSRKRKIFVNMRDLPSDSFWQCLLSSRAFFELQLLQYYSNLQFHEKLVKSYEIATLAKNRNIGEKMPFWQNVAISAKHRNFGKKSPLWRKIASLAKNRHFNCAIHYAPETFKMCS